MHPLDHELQKPRSHSNAEVLAELHREIEMRRRVYPTWCAAGKITIRTAADRIRLLEIALSHLQSLYREDSPLPIQQIELPFTLPRVELDPRSR